MHIPIGIDYIVYNTCIYLLAIPSRGNSNTTSINITNIIWGGGLY